MQMMGRGGGYYPWPPQNMYGQMPPNMGQMQYQQQMPYPQQMMFPPPPAQAAHSGQPGGSSAQSSSGRYFSLDVECVATSVQHNGRSVAQLALVDMACQPLLNIYVKPVEEVVSYLTPLTNLTKQLLDEQGVPFEKAIATLKTHLPQDAILVGHNINADVQWLGLKEGVDFDSMLDLAGLWRVWNEKYRTMSVFGQDHIAACLLNVPNEERTHDASTDAIISMKSFLMHEELKQQGPEALKQAKQKLLDTTVAASFAKRNPTFEGCCMGNRKTCKCGAPFFG